MKLSVEDFLLLDDAGAFVAHAKTELIDGAVVAMNAQFQQHAWVKSELYLRLAIALAPILTNHRALVEAAMSCPPHGLPEPDILVTTSFRGGRQPVPVLTVVLVVEVADTTLDFDLGAKHALYAAANIPEYWVVDIGAGLVHRLWHPADGGYRDHDDIPIGQRLSSATIDGLSFPTDWN